jgi:hypothetical protein
MRISAALHAVCLAAALALGGCGEKAQPAAPPAAPPAAKAAASDLVSQVGRRVGDESAKVQVVAVLPVSRGCQDQVGLYILDAARANPAMLSAVVYDMKGDDGQRVLKEKNHTCLSVFVNGSTKFDVGDAGRKVMLEGPLDYNYSMDDVRDVLMAELKKAYGDKAPKLPPPPAAEGPGNAAPKAGSGRDSPAKGSAKGNP